MKAKTDEPLVIFENYSSIWTPFFEEQPGYDDFRHGNTLRNFKWFGRYGPQYFEDRCCQIIVIDGQLAKSA